METRPYNAGEACDVAIKVFTCIKLLGTELRTCLRRCLRLQLHGAVYRPNSFVLMLRHCVNLKATRYESMSLNRIVADKSHRVIVA